MSSVRESIETVDRASNETGGETGAANCRKPHPNTTSAESSGTDPSNPYCFPDFVMPSGFHFNGARVMKLPVKDHLLTHFNKIYALPMRENDIIITAYPKCGTHWVAEILHMLTTGSTDFSGRTKEHTMLEFCEDPSFLASLPSPRVLNSHLFTAQLPREVVEKKVKIVHVIRNVKDAVVSMYHQLKQTAPEQFTFDNFLKGYVTGKYSSVSHQFDYLRQMAEFEKTHPGHPIMHVHYEDLKQDPAAVIEELSKFLELPVSVGFCQEVASACGFNNMKKADETRQLPENIRTGIKEKLIMYRKGIVGDWKNQFTVAQNEMFDEFIAVQKLNDFGFTLRALP